MVDYSLSVAIAVALEIITIEDRSHSGAVPPGFTILQLLMCGYKHRGRVLFFHPTWTLASSVDTGVSSIL